MTDQERIEQLETRCDTLEAALTAYCFLFMGKVPSEGHLATMEAHTRDDVPESEPLAFMLKWLLKDARHLKECKGG